MTRASDTARLLGAGATILDGTTISTADNTPQLTLKSTDADANEGPVVDLTRDSGSPADADLLGTLRFRADNSAGEVTNYANISSTLKDATDGTEDGNIFFNVMVAGTSRELLTVTRDSVVVNQDSQDIDFRVESDNTTHALFVEGSSGNIGIGDSDPTRMLHIKALGTGVAEEATIMFENEVGTVGTIGQGDVNSNAMIFTENGSERMRLDASGHLLLNTTTERNGGNLSIDYAGASQAGIGINDTESSNGSPFIGFLTGGTFRGSITNNNNGAVAYNQTSDYRLKENVSYDFDATSRLKQLKPVRFNWIADSDNTTIDGFLAHEVSGIVPQAVTGDKDATKTTENVVLDVNENIIAKGVTEDEWISRKENETYSDDTSWKASITQKHWQQIDHSKLVPLLVKTIQELEARITTLENA